jgi:AcrR family transcriptional regulator
MFRYTFPRPARKRKVNAVQMLKRPPRRPATVRRKPAADRRIEVVRAARKLFARDGFEGVSMRALAAASGVSPAALYLYFPDKHALLVAVCDDIFGELIAMFANAPAPAGLDRFARLRGFMRAYVGWGVAHPDEYRLLFLVKEMHMPGASHRGPAVPGGPQLGPALFAMLVAEVQALMADGTMREADATMTAEAIWASGHGLIALLTTLKTFPFTPADRLTDHLTDVILRGLSAG